MASLPSGRPEPNTLSHPTHGGVLYSHLAASPIILSLRGLACWEPLAARPKRSRGLSYWSDWLTNRTTPINSAIWGCHSVAYGGVYAGHLAASQVGSRLALGAPGCMPELGAFLTSKPSNRREFWGYSRNSTSAQLRPKGGTGPFIQGCF
jgi:hypothetical protein